MLYEAANSAFFDMNGRDEPAGDVPKANTPDSVLANAVLIAAPVSTIPRLVSGSHARLRSHNLNRHPFLREMSAVRSVLGVICSSAVRCRTHAALLSEGYCCVKGTPGRRRSMLKVVVGRFSANFTMLGFLGWTHRCLQLLLPALPSLL